MRGIIKLSLLGSFALLTGCATVVNDSSQPIRIETTTTEGDEIEGVECKVTNDKGHYKMSSGDTVLVRRSSKDLDISCVSPKKGKASARLISRVNGGMFGNIVLGGGVGAIIDHNKGTAYTYPSWVKLVFGDTLVFDKSNEKEGLPTRASTLAELNKQKSKKAQSKNQLTDI